jgi:uncharacterized membrane protein YgcG
MRSPGRFRISFRFVLALPVGGQNLPETPKEKDIVNMEFALLVILPIVIFVAFFGFVVWIVSQSSKDRRGSGDPDASNQSAMTTVVTGDTSKKSTKSPEAGASDTGTLSSSSDTGSASYGGGGSDGGGSF